MSLSGDLATLELADLLQNIEIHKRSGVLSVEREEETAKLYFEDGSLELLTLSPVPLELTVLAKTLAHWLTTGLPVIAATPKMMAAIGRAQGSGW